MKHIIIALFAALTIASCGTFKTIHTTPTEDSIIHLITTDSNARFIVHMGIDELRAYLDSKGVSYSQQSTIYELLRFAYEAYLRK